MFRQLVLKRLASCLAVLSVAIAAPTLVEARGGGTNHAFGLNAGLVTTEQERMNTLITRANTREGGISTGDLDSAYEGSVFYQYRFDGSMMAVQLRPSFFYQAQDGRGGSGDFEYSVTGFSVFPILRIHPLENDWMKFFLQFGLGYGRLNGEIKEGPNKVEFAGGSFGTLVGFGTEICFTDNHCMSVEGNYRYLLIERNIASDVSGDFSTSGNSLSQAQRRREVELDQEDLQTRMSGLQFLLGYAFHF